MQRARFRTPPGTTAQFPDARANRTLSAPFAVGDLLIVLDRSASMLPSGKWNEAVAGIEQAVETLDPDVRTGLLVFPAPRSAPTPTDCSLLTDPAVAHTLSALQALASAAVKRASWPSTYAGR